MRNTRICARSGCENTTRRKEKKYCSDACWKLVLYAGETYPKSVPCLECEEIFEVSYSNRSQRFCNRSCAASFSNRGVKRNFRTKKCQGCEALVTSDQTYCSVTCRTEHKIAKWLAGEPVGSVHPHGSVIRTYLYENQNYTCAICPQTTIWNGQELRFILDHVDGNSENNVRSNLRLVCGNCDLQLPTSRGKNRGNGRYKRRLRYANGKSS